jgi:disulfide bond formation protein DsbB
MDEDQQGNLARFALFAAWLIALFGTAGSLFFSEVMNYPPCALCWYQRIALYPLVFVIGIGIGTQDRGVVKYALPITLAGLVIAVYHNLLYYGFIAEKLAPCTEGVPCNAVQLELMGFITIPLMSLAAFLAIAICLIIYRKYEK